GDAVSNARGAIVRRCPNGGSPHAGDCLARAGAYIRGGPSTTRNHSPVRGGGRSVRVAGAEGRSPGPACRAGASADSSPGHPRHVPWNGSFLAADSRERPALHRPLRPVCPAPRGDVVPARVRPAAAVRGQSLLGTLLRPVVADRARPRNGR